MILLSHHDHLDPIYLRPINMCLVFPKLACVHFTILSQSIFPTSHDPFNSSIPGHFCLTTSLTLLSVPMCIEIKKKKNADGSIFCVCRANLCVTNPSGTAGKRCDKNSHSLNLLKRKKYQNVANKRSRNS